MVLTNRGRNLQAKAQAGAQLNFTRFGVGDGELGGSSILELNALKHQVKSVNISKAKPVTGGKATIGMVLSNQDLATGFYFREIGLFAQDPDVGEILYCYANAGATADYIPAGGGTDVVEKSFDVIAIVGTAANVTATIDSSLIYVSAQEFHDHENNDTIHVTQEEKAAWDEKETTTGSQEKVDALAGEGNTKTVKEIDDELKTHKADIMYQKAGGTATAITLTGVVLDDGHPKTFIVSANNAGASTTINGKPLYKPGTTTAPTLIIGKAYTVWYDLTSDCFFIKASAEGDAVVANVLAGKKFSNDNDTGLVGTMPNKGTFNLALGAPVPAGYYSGGTVPNGKKFVSGTAYNVDPYAGQTITGLAFTPSVILMYSTDSNYSGMSGLVSNGSATKWVASGAGNYTVNTQPTSGSFKINVSGLGFTTNVYWIAIE